MVGCAVFTCKRRSETSNLSKNGVSYHTFPKDPYLRKDWITFCQKSVNWAPTRTSVICSDHFEPFSFAENSKHRRRLTESAKPTISHCNFKESEFKSVPSKSYVQSAEEQNASLMIDPTSLKRIPSPCYVPPTSATQSKIIETTGMRKLRAQLEFSNKKIKRLHAKNRYLQQKVNGLQELLDAINKKSLIIKKQRGILLKKIQLRKKNFCKDS